MLESFSIMFFYPPNTVIAYKCQHTKMNYIIIINNYASNPQLRA